jgi:beta-glucosidase
MNRSRRTPVPFWWGISSSAFQTEDRGEHPDSPNYFRTDWDLFADAKRVPPKGDTAEFSWSNFDRDLDALKKIGVSHYRFSVEWARVEPQPGRYNEAAIRRYVDMARKLKAAGGFARRQKSSARIARMPWC